MPLYEVEHICPLTVSQQDELAAAITKIHTEKFTAPALFVNVRFTNISEQTTYVGGKRRQTNRILAHVRHGPSRTQDDYADLCSKITKVWDATVPLPRHPFNATGRVDVELRAIFVLGDIVAGMEAGFVLPEAGKDVQWFKENMVAFKKKAEDGDDEFQDMVAEIERRGLIKNGS
ncbi:hypothetical protein B0A49_01842 [Cryomyces minteri]|uniref:Tautomerase cis-CaaD-like domain-containing protein n=1 Tax=Cryomyces minteri TaxID=331657 RepID=A0A4U0XLM3_9PEZI|nr:hypothetical protein B0A49_01842 [Cryomyces minteri]